METNPNETQRLFSVLDSINRRMDTIEMGFHDLTNKLEENTKDTKEIREWVSAFKAIRTTGKIIKTGATWLASVVAGGAAVIAILKWMEKL